MARRITRKTLPAITPELRSAVETYLLAKAHVAMLKPIVDGISRAAMASSPVHIDDEFMDEARFARRGVASFTDGNGYITDPDKLFMGRAADLDGYYAAKQALIDAEGLTPDNPDHCPLLVAESDLSDAEKVVIDAASYLTARAGKTPITSKTLINSGLANYRKYVDLTVSFVLAQCPDLSAASVMAKVTA